MKTGGHSLVMMAVCCLQVQRQYTLEGLLLRRGGLPACGITRGSWLVTVGSQMLAERGLWSDPDRFSAS